MGIISYLRHAPNVGWLVFGAVLLILSGVYTSMGKVYVRFEGWTYRSEKPKQFWWWIACYFVGGICFLSLFLYNLFKT